jgi:hypothetical protein
MLPTPKLPLWAWKPDLYTTGIREEPYRDSARQGTPPSDAKLLF